MVRIDEDGGDTAPLEQRNVLVRWIQREHDHAISAVAARERAEAVGALLDRLDVEDDEVVCASPDTGDDASQPLDRRRVREERDDDRDRLRAAEGQAPRDGARRVLELLDDLEDALARGSTGSREGSG